MTKKKKTTGHLSKNLTFNSLGFFQSYHIHKNVLYKKEIFHYHIDSHKDKRLLISTINPLV
jgi:hypothetical protein